MSTKDVTSWEFLRSICPSFTRFDLVPLQNFDMSEDEEPKIWQTLLNDDCANGSKFSFLFFSFHHCEAFCSCTVSLVYIVYRTFSCRVFCYFDVLLHLPVDYLQVDKLV